ncbi:MAG: hypothetical protein OQJ91_03245 [Motiliproteus sp.]|nr:hypothetical protein [Motiliproteus sp.]
MTQFKHPIPTWVIRGKTIADLIQELQSFENQQMEVRLSLDNGDSSACISLVAKQEGCCVLINAESYHQNEWQDFMDQPKENE